MHKVGSKRVLTLPTMTGKIISPRPPLTTMNDVIDAENRAEGLKHRHALSLPMLRLLSSDTQ